MVSKYIDIFWHEFILFTTDYKSFCDKSYGEYLHHIPNKTTDNVDAIKDNDDNTLLCIESLYKILLNRVDPFRNLDFYNFDNNFDKKEKIIVKRGGSFDKSYEPTVSKTTFSTTPIDSNFLTVAALSSCSSSSPSHSSSSSSHSSSSSCSSSSCSSCSSSCD
jgi:hypothetical protein